MEEWKLHSRMLVTANMYSWHRVTGGGGGGGRGGVRVDFNSISKLVCPTVAFKI